MTTRCPECDREFFDLRASRGWRGSAAVQLQAHLYDAHEWDSDDAWRTVMDFVYPEEAVWPHDVVELTETAEEVFEQEATERTEVF